MIDWSLRYGYAFHREVLLEIALQYQLYVSIATLLTFHPVIQYLLIFESKSMQKDIRLLYIFTHLALILNEWTIFVAFRVYCPAPFAAIYCGGPLCKCGIGKQTLMTILAIPVILITSPFIALMARMHQTFVPYDSRSKLSTRTQIILALLLNSLLIANVVGFGYFGRDHDDSERILKEPELSWLTTRGGTIFVFGPPGDPQYFKWELIFLFASIITISPFLYFFTADSIIIQSSSTHAMARKMLQVFIVQCSGALFCYIVPLSVMLSSMMIDSSFIPKWLFAPGRVLMLMLFQFNSQQFCIFFIFKNPTYRKILLLKIKRFIPRILAQRREESPVAPNNFSVTSRHFELRF